MAVSKSKAHVLNKLSKKIRVLIPIPNLIFLVIAVFLESISNHLLKVVTNFTRYRAVQPTSSNDLTYPRQDKKT